MEAKKLMVDLNVGHFFYRKIKYMKICYGDLLDCDCDIIAHQVNCMGVMGAGLANQIRMTYPKVFEDYVNLCVSKGAKALFGTISYTKTPRYWVVNLFGQYNTGIYKRQTDYEKLGSALELLKEFALNNNLKTIGLPYNLGCGLAGGNWEIVQNMILDVFENSGLEVEIWKLK